MEAMNFVPEGCIVSLQPLNLKKSINDRGPKISERVYRPGVLQGNWYEDSAKISPIPQPEEWSTLYETTYKPFKTELLTRPKFEAWEQRIRNQGVGARLMIDHHGTEYHNNWTTSYDLSFRILPKGLGGPRPREFNASKKEWLPEQDYSTVYGNLTNFGLTDFMRHKWSNENKPMQSLRTDYQDGFQIYENAPFIRFLKPKASLNEPDLRHLGIDLSAPRKSCPIARVVKSTQIQGSI